MKRSGEEGMGLNGWSGMGCKVTSSFWLIKSIDSRLIVILMLGGEKREEKEEDEEGQKPGLYTRGGMGNSISTHHQRAVLAG